MIVPYTYAHRERERYTYYTHTHTHTHILYIYTHSYRSVFLMALMNLPECSPLPQERSGHWLAQISGRRNSHSCLDGGRCGRGAQDHVTRTSLHGVPRLGVTDVPNRCCVERPRFARKWWNMLQIWGFPWMGVPPNGWFRKGQFPLKLMI